VTLFGAAGTAGSACVDELIRQDQFKVQVLARKGGQLERTSMGPVHSDDERRRRYVQWSSHGVVVKSVDETDHAELIPALRGTDYLVSCVPYSATESQYPLIFAAREAGVERFVPSEFGATTSSSSSGRRTRFTAQCDLPGRGDCVLFLERAAGGPRAAVRPQGRTELPRRRGVEGGVRPATARAGEGNHGHRRALRRGSRGRAAG